MIRLGPDVDGPGQSWGDTAEDGSAAAVTESNHSAALSAKRSAASVTPKALTRNSSYLTYPIETILFPSLTTSPTSPFLNAA